MSEQRDPDYVKFYIKLLEMEIRALRSVLSEWNTDKEQFTQWQKAETIDQLKNHLVHPS